MISAQQQQMFNAEMQQRQGLQQNQGTYSFLKSRTGDSSSALHVGIMAVCRIWKNYSTVPIELNVIKTDGKSPRTIFYLTIRECFAIIEFELLLL